MPRRQQLFEEAGGQRLPLGGLNGYAGVRGKQGKKKDKFQGTTPKKKHRTQLFATSLEAAIALAQLREDLELGMLEQRSLPKAKSPKTTAASKKKEVGVYLGELLRHSSGRMSQLWHVYCCRSSRRLPQWRAVCRWRMRMCWRRYRTRCARAPAYMCVLEACAR